MCILSAKMPSRRTLAVSDRQQSIPLMKLFTFLFCLTFSFIYGQTNYVIFPGTCMRDMIYQMSDSSVFVDRYFKPTITNELAYCMRIRFNSWDDRDTAYFREDKKNYYACTDLNRTYDYIEIPKRPKARQIWYNIDSSWTYTILSIDTNLVTPAKTYEHVVAIQALQPEERNNLHTNYINYYAGGIGFVGSVVDKKLFCYLTEIQEK